MESHSKYDAKGLATKHTLSQDWDRRWELWDAEGLPSLDELRVWFEPAELIRIGEMAGELSDRLERCRAAQAVSDWLLEPGDWEEALDRRAVLHALEQASGLDRFALAWAGMPAPPPWLRPRPLRPLELGVLVRHAAGNPLRRALVGVALTGAGTGELKQLTPASVRDTGEIELPGVARHVLPRVRPIEDWARRAVQELARDAKLRRGSGGPLLVNSRLEAGSEKVQSALCMHIRNLLRRDVIGDDPTLQPNSLRATAGRRVYDREGLEAAGWALGVADHRWSDLRAEIGLVAPGASR